MDIPVFIFFHYRVHDLVFFYWQDDGLHFVIPYDSHLVERMILQAIEDGTERP